MAKSVLITLTLAGADTGPFSLYSNDDGYITPFETGVGKIDLTSGYTSVVVPDGATIIRVQSEGPLCTNYVDLVIGDVPTTTTTTTAEPTTTTTTTTEEPTTTTTSSTTEAPNAEITLDNLTTSSDVVVTNLEIIIPSLTITPTSGSLPVDSGEFFAGEINSTGGTFTVRVTATVNAGTHCITVTGSDLVSQTETIVSGGPYTFSGVESDNITAINVVITAGAC